MITEHPVRVLYEFNQKTPIFLAFYRGSILRNQWCQIADVFLTVNPDNFDVFKLKNLVEQFNLTNDLLG